MTKQEKIEAATLSSALVAALAEIGSAAKDKVNPHFKSKYADLSSVVDAIKPVLARHGLAFTQSTEPSEGGVVVETILWFDGPPDNIETGRYGATRTSLGKLFVPANKNDAQGFGSALTYARRYSLMTAFGVPAEDDDGNAAVSSARPTMGEAPPVKRVPLDGPYTSKTALWAAVRSFVAEANSAGDQGEWIALRECKETKALLAQCERDAPGLLRDGIAEMPEYEPLEIFIARKNLEMEELESIANSPGAKMLASG